MVAATVTGICAPFTELMEFGNSLAVGAGELGSPKLDLHDFFQAGAVVWKFGLKMLECVFHGRHLLMGRR